MQRPGVAVAAEPAPRIVFARQRRGVVALLVVLLHLGVSFWFDRNGVAGRFGIALGRTSARWVSRCSS